VRDALRQLHPDERVCAYYRAQAAKHDRTIADLFARTRALLDRADALIEAGAPPAEIDAVLDAVDAHQILIKELMTE
jgi:hypothetical protein